MKSDHFNGEEFFNPAVQTKKEFKDLLKWSRTRNPKKWPTNVPNKHQPKIAYLLESTNICVTYINHSTFLIQLAGANNTVINILTDPVFSERTSPINFLGPKRVRRPGIEITALPKIDIVLVSHNHYDHMDMPSLKSLVKRFDPVIITPLGNKKYFNPVNNPKILEGDWWETINLDLLKLKIHFTPAHHWSRRTFTDTNKALWSGMIIETAAHNIFFAGDSGYQNHFQQIAQRFPKIDLSFLPIGAYQPRWFMKDAHMNPEEAVMAHLDLKSIKSIGMHFGTFQLADEGMDEPLIDLLAAQEKLNVHNFEVLNVGETKLF